MANAKAAVNTASKTTDWGKHAAAIDALARESQRPVAEVEALYRVECAHLEMVARITTYVPVIVSRRVRAQLRTGNDTKVYNS